MTIASWVRRSTAKLIEADIPTARLDCLILLEDQTKKDRSWLLAHPELDLQIEVVQNLNKKVTRRARHEPLAYIRNNTEFYGREFYIDHRVLEPRPESETMIDILKTLRLPPAESIIDIGTGSGALAITARLELPEAKVLAIDIDTACLQVASKNAQALGANIHFLQGNLLEPLDTDSQLQAATLLCNLPYVPETFQINEAAMHEPRVAIFGGPDGLDIYRALFGQISNLKCTPRYILTESLPPQHEALAKIASDSGFRLQKTDDFVQLFVEAI
jgi:release factor glutamine methyltransferase